MLHGRLAQYPLPTLLSVLAVLDGRLTVHAPGRPAVELRLRGGALCGGRVGRRELVETGLRGALRDLLGLADAEFSFASDRDVRGPAALPVMAAVLAAQAELDAGVRAAPRPLWPWSPRAAGV